MTHDKHPCTNYLFRLRRIRKLSQKRLAFLIGITAQAVSDLERGRRLPSLKVAMLLEIVLGAKVSEIYPDFYRELGVLAVSREDRIPHSRHIRGRVLGKD